LRKRFDRPVSPEIKRKIVDTLVKVVQANTIEHWGVQETELTIRYRFSEPSEATPLILSRSHRLSTRNRIPEKFETVGDHLLLRRLALILALAASAGTHMLSTCSILKAMSPAEEAMIYAQAGEARRPFWVELHNPGLQPVEESGLV
jgi:hypothetical protein